MADDPARRLREAIGRHQAGEVETAAAVYREVLEQDPSLADAWHLLGLTEHQRGRSAQGAELIRRAIRLSPQTATFHASLGNALRGAGEVEAAVESLERAVGIDPGFAVGWTNLGHALRAACRDAEAAEAFAKAVELAPDLAEARYNLATTLHASGRIDDAIREYRAALSRKPDLEPARDGLVEALIAEAARLRRSEAPGRERPLLEEAVSLAPHRADARVGLAYGLLAQAHYDEALAQLDAVRQSGGEPASALICRALVLDKKGDPAQAVEALGRIGEADPAYPLAQQILGELLSRTEDIDAAIEARRRAVAAEPENLDLRKSLGDLLQVLGRSEQAEEVYLQALEIDPNAWTVHNSLGTLYVRRADWRLALKAFRQALVPEPRVEPLINLGVLLRRLGRLQEATRPLKLALELEPDNPKAANNLALTEADQGRLRDADSRLRQALASSPDAASIHSNLLYFLNFRDEVAPREILREHLEWSRRHAEPLAPAGPVRPLDPDPERTLRIGYISPDFRRHSVAFFFAPVLEAHDRTRYEIHCYAELHRPDEVTERLRQASDGWLEITGWTAESVARRIREDGIDILVDLAGHTGDNRLLVFARRPAPVQVSWLGYPNTTGMKAMDYRLVDAVTEPPGLADRLSVERVVRLPEGFHCYEPLAEAPDVAELPAARTGRVTFGSFNDMKKMQPQVIRCWAEILSRVPGSRLFLKCVSFADAPTRQIYEQAFAEHGIDSDRLVMIPRVSSLTEHLGLYGEIDLALDSFPYNGTTTTCEALWMGVPVLTIAGDRHASRVGASLLTRVGLEDWIAESPEDYVERAVAWVGRLEELARLRAGLRERMRRSPLCDPERFTRALENAYREMWRAACAGAVRSR